MFNLITLPMLCAYILGYANANRDIADLVAYNEMRVCAQAAASMNSAVDLRSGTFRDEHQPGALRHIAAREYRLDNGPGERAYIPKPIPQWMTADKRVAHA